MPATGSVTVSNGATLAVGAGSAGEFTANTTGNGSIGALLSGSGALGQTVTWNNGAILGIDTTNATGGVTYTGVIANSGGNAIGLTKLGSNTLTLTADNTYTGPTTVIAGGLGISGSPAGP